MKFKTWHRIWRYKEIFLFKRGSIQPHGPHCDQTSLFSNIPLFIEVALQAFNPFGLIGHFGSLCFELP